MKSKINVLISASLLIISNFVSINNSNIFAAAGGKVTCRGAFGDPHNSTHVPYMINAKGFMKCNRPIPHMRIDIWLINFDTNLTVHKFKIVQYSKYVSQQAYLPCNPKGNRYRATYVLKGTMPPGIIPPNQYSEKRTEMITLTCKKH